MGCSYIKFLKTPLLGGVDSFAIANGDGVGKSINPEGVEQLIKLNPPPT